MKLRYQLRGLGIGIIVTALLMGVATKDGIPLTDAEIKARALALGMVESDSLKLTDIGNVTPEPDGQPGLVVPSGQPTQNPEGAPAGTQEPGGDLAATPVPEADGNSAGIPTQNPDGAPAESPMPGPGGVVEIIIELGENSLEICKKLEDAGLVSDAAAFDRYLCDNGYSRRIREGVYKIPVGCSEEEIVGMLVTMN